MKCSNCGKTGLANITRHGETATCKDCGAEFIVRTSADGRRGPVIVLSRLALTDAEISDLAAEYEDACYEDKGESAYGRED